MNTRPKITKIDLPSFWAGYLINGEPDNLTTEEVEECDKATEGLGSCSEVSEEEFFSTYHGIGHTMATYTFIKYNS